MGPGRSRWSLAEQVLHVAGHVAHDEDPVAGLERRRALRHDELVAAVHEHRERAVAQAEVDDRRAVRDGSGLDRELSDTGAAVAARGDGLDRKAWALRLARRDTEPS